MHNWFRTPTLLPGRALFSLQQVQKRVPADQPQLGQSVAAALEITRAQWDAVGRWARVRKNSKSRGNTLAIDRQADAALADMAGVCTGLTRLGDAHPMGAAATALLARFFPEGVSAVIRVNYEKELLLIEDMLAAMAQPPAAEWVAILPIGDLVDQLTALAPQYRTQLEAEREAERDAITWPEVRATLVASRDALETVVSGARFLIADADARAYLLAPIEEQIARQRAARVRNKDTVDLNPETGEEVPIEPLTEG